jgi:hypothetical protein
VPRKATTQTRRREGGLTVIMSDDDIEAMLRALVEEHVAEDARSAALNWLEKRHLIRRCKTLGWWTKMGTADAATGVEPRGGPKRPSLAAVT